MVEIGRGTTKATCPVEALTLWLSLARISHGSVFRRMREANRNVGSERLNDVHIARLVKTTALAAGIRGDLTEGQRRALFSGHSLRSGFASSVTIDEAHIQRQMGHASPEMTRSYQQKRTRFTINMTKAAGL